MKNIFLLVLDSVRRDFFFDSFLSQLNELKNDFVQFTNCHSIYTSTCLSHYTIFFGDYFGKARNQNFPAQLKNFGYKSRSFCNGAIIRLYPLKGNLEPSLNNKLPYRNDIIRDLGIEPAFNWNRELFGSKFEDYTECADDEKNKISEKWKKYIIDNKERKNIIFLHFWNTHHNYNINEYLKAKIEGENIKEIGQNLLAKIINKEITEKFVKKVYSTRIYEILSTYIKDLIKLLKENNIYTDSLIIITSDHGEGLGDIGFHFTKRLHKFYDKIKNFILMNYNEIIQKRLRFLPKIKTFYLSKYDFFTFYHSGQFKLQKQIPLLVKFPNNEFGGKFYDNKVSLFDIIHTVNNLIDKKIKIGNFYGHSLYSLLKEGETSREKYKLDVEIKKLISLEKLKGI